MTGLTCRSLKKVPTINILFRENQTSPPAMLQEGFPKELAVAFSGLCHQSFPSLTAMSVADLSKPRSNSVIVVGGNVDSHKAVLSWMLSCCEGRGMQQFPRPERRRFWHYTCALESAELFDIGTLRDELWRILTEIANYQVHTEDIRAIYSLTEEAHPMRGMVAESIGRALLDRRLNARLAYKYLREDPTYQAFNDDVGVAIQRMKKEYAESEEGKAERAEYLAVQKTAQAEYLAAKKAAREDAQKRRQKRQNNPRNLTPTDVAKELDVPAEAVKAEEDGTFKVTVSSDIVRKGRRNGRGRYAALPLRQAGVTAEMFRPDPEPVSQRPDRVTAAAAAAKNTSAKSRAEPASASPCKPESNAETVS